VRLKDLVRVVICHQGLTTNQTQSACGVWGRSGMQQHHADQHGESHEGDHEE
jgi:hypothetical protein